jgi:VWFA-related protein
MSAAAGWVVSLSLVAGTVAPLAQDRPQPFRSGTQLVTIDVSVLRRNAPVAGLTARDFVLLDNGVPQAIELQGVDGVPIDVSLVFDRSASSQATIGSRFEADLAKIALMLRPIDRLRVIAFATGVREVLPMQPVKDVRLAGLPDLAPAPVAAEARRPGLPSRGLLDFRYDPALRRWSLFDALLLAAARPPEAGRRHVVVAFAVGQNTGSVLLDGPLFRTVISRADALLHVGLWDRGGYTRDGLGLKYWRLALSGAAADTGGAIHDVNDTVKAFKKILEDFRRRYILRYTVTGVPTGGWHTVEVRTPKFPTFVIRARKGYLGR